jgi:hypothetical protein
MTSVPVGRKSPRAESWAAAWSSRKFRIQAVLAVILMAAVVTIFSGFLEYVEARPGAVLQDPVLLVLAPRDVTWLTFSLIYFSVLLAFGSLLRRPDALLLALQSYTLLVVFRMGAMYLLPLDPPPGMIALKDPFVEYIVGDGEILTKDLFFSGHTSTMFLLCTGMVGFCVLWQHVHYSVDVLAAPFFSYGAVQIATMVHTRLRRA